MTWSDVTIFEKVNCTTSYPNASSLVTADAMILKRHDHIPRTVMGSFIEFSLRLLSQTGKSYGDIIMALYFWLSHMWLSNCTWAHKNIIQLNVLTIFLYKFISEASQCHMCKFYRIASNSLQAIQIVHELFWLSLICKHLMHKISRIIDEGI